MIEPVFLLVKQAERMRKVFLTIKEDVLNFPVSTDGCQGLGRIEQSLQLDFELDGQSHL